MTFIFSNLCNGDKVTIDTSGLKKKAIISLGGGCPFIKSNVAKNPYAQNKKPPAIDQSSSNQNLHMKKEPLVLPKDLKNAQNKQKFYNIYNVDEHEQGMVPKSNQPNGNFKQWEPKIDQIDSNNPPLNILNGKKIGQNELTFKKPISEENKLSDVGINTKYPDGLLLDGKNSQTGVKYPFEENTGKPKTYQEGKFMMPYGNPLGFNNPMFGLKPYNNLIKNLNIAKLSGVQENQSVNQDKPLNDPAAVRIVGQNPFKNYVNKPSHRIIDWNKSKDPSERSQSGVLDEINSQMNSDISKISGYDSLDKKTGWSEDSIYEDYFNKEVEVQGKISLGKNSKEDNNKNEDSFDSEIGIENSKQILPRTDSRISPNQFIFSSPTKLENIEVKTQRTKDDGLIDYKSIFLDLEDDNEGPEEVWQQDFIKRRQLPRVSVKYDLKNFSLAESSLRNTPCKPIRKIKKVYLFEILKCRDCLRDRFLNVFIANGFVGPKMSKF